MKNSLTWLFLSVTWDIICCFHFISRAANRRPMAMHSKRQHGRLQTSRKKLCTPQLDVIVHVSSARCCIHRSAMLSHARMHSRQRCVAPGGASCQRDSMEGAAYARRGGSKWNAWLSAAKMRQQNPRFRRAALVMILLLALHAHPAVDALIQFPDGTDMMYQGTITVPRGNVVLLTFSGRSDFFCASARLSNLSTQLQASR